MKKMISAAMALVLLVALTGASASSAGSAMDPLITKDYGDKDYPDSVFALGEDLIDSRLDELRSAVDAILNNAGSPDFSHTDGLEAFINSGLGSVTMGQGGSFILNSGSATVTFKSGEVINVKTGESVPSGSSLNAMTRYFCTENTTAVFTPSSLSTFMLDGPYSLGAGVHPQYEFYDDVFGNEWYTDASRYSYESHIFHDWNASLFRGGDDATRAEMIYAMWVTAKSPKTDFTLPIKDLTEDWYVTAVYWAYENIITDGDGEYLVFNPNGVLSRQQILTMLYRWTKNNGYDVSASVDISKFTDHGDIDTWAAEGVSWGAAVGLIYGYDDGSFGPKLSIQRAELATIMMRYNDLLTRLKKA